MSKYFLLLIFNLPFVFFGMLKTVMLYRTNKLSMPSFLLRMSFWSIILAGLFFAKHIYNYLVVNNLTDSTPPSIADVVLATGVIFSIFLCVRLYTKLERTEKRLAELHEKTSIILSKK